MNENSPDVIFSKRKIKKDGEDATRSELEISGKKWNDLCHLYFVTMSLIASSMGLSIVDAFGLLTELHDCVFKTIAKEGGVIGYSSMRIGGNGEPEETEK